MSSKYEREILRRLPKGYKIGHLEFPADDSNNQRRRKAGHHGVLIDPSGEVVRLPSGIPVQISGTPGSDRTIKNDLAGIRRAGVKVS